jgi:transposase InsO family protein
MRTRGGQDAAKKFRRLLKTNGCQQSMSRAVEVYDNPFAESLFSRDKAELLEGGEFSDIEEARRESFQYIEGYDNRVRKSRLWVIKVQWSSKKLIIKELKTNKKLTINQRKE